jgi:DNA primase small subunit
VEDLRGLEIFKRCISDEGVAVGTGFSLDEERGETDEPVTADVRRLIRCPTSLHGGSGLRVTPLTLQALEEFDPLWDAVVFGEEPVAVEVKRPFSTEMIGQSYELQEGCTELPACVAVFLMARGAAELERAAAR